MSRITWTATFLVLFVMARPVPAEPDRKDASSRSEPYEVLKRIVQTSESTSSYTLKVNFAINASDREETITIFSRGQFQTPYFHLRSETPAGMEVESFGLKSSVLHIHPSTDEIVTSDQLGISSVNRTLLDPFEHMSFIVDASRRPASCTIKGTERIGGTSYRELRVEVGTDQVREVMNEFRNQLDRPLKPDKTEAVYRLMYNPETDLIRRIYLTVRSEFVSGDSGEEDGEDWKADLPEPADGAESGEGPVTVDVEGQFDLKKYGSVSDLNIPEDVKRRLKRRGDDP